MFFFYENLYNEDNSVSETTVINILGENKNTLNDTEAEKYRVKFYIQN